MSLLGLHRKHNVWLRGIDELGHGDFGSRVGVADLDEPRKEALLVDPTEVCLATDIKLLSTNRPMQTLDVHLTRKLFVGRKW